MHTVNVNKKTPGVKFELLSNEDIKLDLGDENGQLFKLNTMEQEQNISCDNTYIQFNKQHINRPPRIDWEDYPQVNAPKLLSIGHKDYQESSLFGRDLSTSHNQIFTNLQQSVIVPIHESYDSYSSHQSIVSSFNEADSPRNGPGQVYNSRTHSALNGDHQPQRAFSDERSYSRTSVTPPKVDRYLNETGQIEQRIEHFLRRISNIFQDYSPIYPDGRVITPLNFESYCDSLVTLNQSQSLNLPIPKNLQSLRRTVYLRLQPKPDYAMFLEQHGHLFQLRRHMPLLQPGPEVHSRLGLVMRYEQSLVLFLRPFYLKYQKQGDNDKKIQKLGAFSDDFYDEIHQQFIQCKLDQCFEIHYNPREVPTKFKQKLLTRLQSSDVEIDRINTDTIAEAIATLCIVIKKNLNGIPIGQPEYNRFSREFEKFLGFAKDKFKNNRLTFINSEYIYQSLMVPNQEEAKQDDQQKYLMEILKIRQADKSEKWQKEFNHYLGINMVINELLGVPEDFAFILQPSKHLRLNTNFQTILNNKVFTFVQEELRSFTILMREDRKFKGWPHIGSDQFNKEFKRYYLKDQKAMSNYAQLWLGKQIQEKEIQPFILMDQFRIHLCQFGKELAIFKGNIPSCYDPLYTFSEFAVVPLMLAMHSGFIHFTVSDSNRDMRSILMVGPSTVGKSFYQDIYNQVYKGALYTQKKSQDTQWFNADAFAYNSWSIAEVTQDTLFSNFMKLFADFGQKLSTNQKGKDDIVIPSNRQVIMAFNQDLSLDSFTYLFRNFKNLKAFEDDIFTPVMGRMLVVYAQKPIDSVGLSIVASEISQLVTSEHQVSVDNSVIQAKIFFIVTTYLFGSEYKQFKNPEERSTMLMLIAKFEQTIFGHLVKYNLEDFVNIVGPQFRRENLLTQMNQFYRTQELMQDKQRSFLFDGYLNLGVDEFNKAFKTRDIYHDFITKPLAERLQFYESHKNRVKELYTKYYQGNRIINFDRVSPLYQQKIDYLTQ